MAEERTPTKYPFCEGCEFWTEHGCRMNYECYKAEDEDKFYGEW